MQDNWNDTNFDEFDTEDRLTGQDTGGDLVKQLRREIKKRDDALKTIETEFKTLKAADRTRTVEKVLSDKKIPGKVARLIPETVEPTAEAVDKWLEEYGDLFGITEATTDNSETGETTVPVMDRTTLARIDQSAQGGVQPLNRMAEQIHAVKTMPEADFLKLIDDAQKGAS